MNILDIIQRRNLEAIMAASVASMDTTEITRSLYDAAAVSTDKLIAAAEREIEEQSAIVVAATERVRQAKIVQAEFARARDGLVIGLDDGPSLEIADETPAQKQRAKGRGR